MAVLLLVFGLLTAAGAELFTVIAFYGGPTYKLAGSLLAMALAIFMGVTANLLIWAGGDRLRRAP